MIGLVPIARIVTCIAVSYAILVTICGALFLQFGDDSLWTWTILKSALAGAGVLELALIVWVYFGWRQLWRWVPALNRLLYPDIAGEWNITINWQDDGTEGVVEANAIIRQDFVRVSMEVTSLSSESETLIARPKRDPESGKPLLYYVYLVVPNFIGDNRKEPYFGAAVLKFSETEGGKLSGNYWTSKQTRGHFRLSRQVQ